MRWVYSHVPSVIGNDSSFPLCFDGEKFGSNFMESQPKVSAGLCVGRVLFKYLYYGKQYLVVVYTLLERNSQKVFYLIHAGPTHLYLLLIILFSLPGSEGNSKFKRHEKWPFASSSLLSSSPPSSSQEHRKSRPLLGLSP
jgi:hypothetical protein